MHPQRTPKKKQTNTRSERSEDQKGWSGVPRYPAPLTLAGKSIVGAVVGGVI